MKVEVELGSKDEMEEKKKEYGKYDKWEIDSAVRTLLEAEEIKMDKDKMKYVAMCMKEKADAMVEAVNSLDDLKALAKKKLKEESEEA